VEHVKGTRWNSVSKILFLQVSMEQHARSYRHVFQVFRALHRKQGGLLFLVVPVTLQA
jgi:hypothetical protein